MRRPPCNSPFGAGQEGLYLDRNTIYRDIAGRTDGDIYIGIVGPVRTGKSAFIKRFMELAVLPEIASETRRERLRDEMPQSGAGKTVMTTQPRFVPDEAIELPLDENVTARVRLADCAGYLIDGAYSREQNLSVIIEARAQVGSNFLAGVAANEADPDGAIDALAQKIGYALENKYVPPQNFYGVGGMKVFRDLIWLMQGMMKADHKFYKAHGQYDFPQKKWPTMLKMYLVGMLISNPKLMAKAGSAMTDGMLAPYRKALEKAKAGE